MQSKRAFSSFQLTLRLSGWEWQMAGCEFKLAVYTLLLKLLQHSRPRKCP